MQDGLAKLLWQLSEAGEPAVLLGRQHAPTEDAAFERMLALGVLLHGDPITAWDICRSCGCGAEERKHSVDDGKPSPPVRPTIAATRVEPTISAPSLL